MRNPQILGKGSPSTIAEGSPVYTPGSASDSNPLSSYSSTLDNKVFTPDSISQPNPLNFSSSIPENTDAPLSRHQSRNSPAPKSISFSDSTIAFAIDCSTSTRGTIRDQEIIAVKTLCDSLSPQSLALSRVLPWSSTTHGILSMDAVDQITEQRGTRPSSLLKDASYQNVLGDASLWCLLTDGQIKEREVQRFASRIARSGLHGTAAIVVLAGYRSKRPLDCDISVGKAVFAVASDCLFLFHDVETSKVYVMQGKGCFKSLLPEGLLLMDHADWSHLPTIDYGALESIKIPRPRKLDSDEVCLAGGQSINLKKLYRNDLDDDMVNRIMSDNENLNTIILTSSVRGEKSKVLEWLMNRNLPAVDPLWAPRPDLQNQCLSMTGQVIDALHHGPRNDELLRLWRSQLQSFHDQSWNLLNEEINSRNNQSDLRHTVILDARQRINLYESNPHSVKHFTPISSILRTTMVRDDPSTMSNSLRSSYTYTLGFKIRPLDEHFKIKCKICGKNGIGAILLKSVSPGEGTEDFPVPGSSVDHEYPMVLGIYPETDIIASEICCETCSVFLIRMHRSKPGEVITGNLPLTSLLPTPDDSNLLQWKQCLTTAFQNRFHPDIVLPIFLSTLYSTIDELADTEITNNDMSENKTLIYALQWVGSTLADCVEVPLDLASPRSQTTSDPSSKKSLRRTLLYQLKALNQPKPALLNYPLDGFVTLMHIAWHVCSEKMAKAAIWLRLLFHLLEQYLLRSDKDELQRMWKQAITLPPPEHHLDERTKSDIKLHSEASKIYASIATSFADAVRPTENPANISSMRSNPVTLSLLESIQLIWTDDVASFERLGQKLPDDEPWFERALELFVRFLFEFASSVPRKVDATSVFDELKREPILHGLFWEPASMFDSSGNDFQNSPSAEDLAVGVRRWDQRVG